MFFKQPVTPREVPESSECRHADGPRSRARGDANAALGWWQYLEQIAAAPTPRK